MPASITTFLVFTVFILPAFALTVCTNLTALFPGKVFLPGTPAYNASVFSYFFLNERQAPACIIVPTTAGEVSEIVKTTRLCATKVAVRSGGHSPNRGFSNTDLDITIDLRGLNEVKMYKINANIVSVGTGALWNDVYTFLDPLNRTSVGSRVASVGLGGFIMGGGISFFSPRHGFSCDNVENMEVVLANGTILDANATSNSRLFRALKGGQSNFGVVTRFDLITHPQSKFWGGAIQYPASADAAQLSVFTAFKMDPYDPFVGSEQTFVYFGSQNTFSSTNNIFYTKSAANGSGLHVFTDIQPQSSSTLRLSRASNFAQELKKFQPVDQFATYSTLSFPIFTGVLPNVHSLWRNSTSSLASAVPDLISVLNFQSNPPPPAANEPQNSLPFPPGSTPHRDIVLTLFSFY
ncbi:FAD-binding domain-containing protein [Xylariaceae sp. AK1471]|nr:FAD-binding domain-containing protein [Xylariaceae sp. AK1471]